MRLEVVNMAAIEPDENNPRDDFGDLEALHESFGDNTERPGEPYQPILVVKDGPVFRIVDGERRFRAMQLGGGLDKCHANVCEDMDEANSVLAMMATNDKMQLSEVERSKGVQQALLLGVPHEKVERNARLAKGAAAKVRRGMAMAEERAEQMGIDHLITIAELEDEGIDADGIDRVLMASEAVYERAAADARTQARVAAMAQSVRSWCEGRGIRVFDDMAERTSGWRSCGYFSDADELEACIDDQVKALGDDAQDAGFEVYLSPSSWGLSGYAYCSMDAPDDEDGEDEQEPEEEARARELYEAACAMDAKARALYLQANTRRRNGDRMSQTIAIDMWLSNAVLGDADNSYSDRCKTEEYFGLDGDGAPRIALNMMGGMIALYLYQRSAPRADRYWFRRMEGCENVYGRAYWDANRALKWVSFMEAVEADGPADDGILAADELALGIRVKAWAQEVLDAEEVG